jgi:hypothetical protein
MASASGTVAVVYAAFRSREKARAAELWRLGAMTRSLAIAVVLLLAGCATSPPLSDGVTLSVRSYDRTTGAYVLELRNSTARPILYLSPYLTFHTTRSPEPEPFPASPDGMALMVHNTKLAPGTSATFSGQCTASGACSRPETYVAVRACWFADAWTCKEYFPVWSETSLNGA